MSSRFEHVGILVRDLERSKSIYCDLLGYRPFFETTVELPDIKRIVLLGKGSERIELMEMRGEQQAPTPTSTVSGLHHLCFDVDDLDKEAQLCGAAGLKVIVTPQHGTVKVPSEEHWRRAVFEGPDGERIEFRGA